MIPITWRYDHSRVVGKLNGNVMTFDPPLLHEDMPVVGWRTLESEVRDGVQYVIRAELMELPAGIELAPPSPREET